MCVHVCLYVCIYLSCLCSTIHPPFSLFTTQYDDFVVFFILGDQSHLESWKKIILMIYLWTYIYSLPMYISCNKSGFSLWHYHISTLCKILIFPFPIFFSPSTIIDPLFLLFLVTWISYESLQLWLCTIMWTFLRKTDISTSIQV